MLTYRVITLPRVLRSAFVSSGGIIFPQGDNMNTWKRVGPVVLEIGQEVES